jgi:hypothetical protein
VQLFSLISVEGKYQPALIRQSLHFDKSLSKKSTYDGTQEAIRKQGNPKELSLARELDSPRSTFNIPR